jgi:hypothetical protein
VIVTLRPANRLGILRYFFRYLAIAGAITAVPLWVTTNLIVFAIAGR